MDTLKPRNSIKNCCGQMSLGYFTVANGKPLLRIIHSPLWQKISVELAEDKVTIQDCKTGEEIPCHEWEPPGTVNRRMDFQSFSIIESNGSDKVGTFKIIKNVKVSIKIIESKTVWKSVFANIGRHVCK